MKVAKYTAESAENREKREKNFIVVFGRGGDSEHMTTKKAVKITIKHQNNVNIFTKKVIFKFW